ncbi:hypothetical protein K4L06_06260 [Lysobacter sp. BMK333-48F3]|uniref:hypothetical protein n=1 Tax=Lysobacter sp. BMK333-48F3 TaxID=2867962 RepID=UPI001C8C7834|nr:hypothetical protein [Lysobacter sp. BMK333-48F3]MBX9400910.1 hypothetical protein [Lysobacter sp. BMK333-48F3]
MDRALDTVTGEEVDAEDLWDLEAVDPGRYECHGCDIPVFPASYRKDINKKRPYFFKPKDIEHHPDCGAQDEDGCLQRARTERVPEEQLSRAGLMPNRLVLRAAREVQAPPGAAGQPVARGRRPGGDAAGAGDTRRHATTANSLRRIAKDYARFPHNRNSPLHIDGIAGRSYERAIARLKFDAVVRYGQAQVWLSQIAWSAKHEDDAERYEIVLSVGDRQDGRVTRPYRVRVHWAGWSARARNALRTEVEVLVQEHKAHRGSGKAAWVFFIGEQDAQEPALFHVRDRRLICTLYGEVPVSGKA